MIEMMGLKNGRDGVGKTRPGLKVLLENEEAKKKQIDLVILMAGTNDLGHGFEKEVIFLPNVLKSVRKCTNFVPQLSITLSKEIVDNIIKLIQVCKDHSVQRILSVGIPDSAFVARVQEARKKRDAINNGLKEYASSTEGFVTYKNSPVRYDSASESFDPDGLHFSPKGYREFSDGIYETVLGLVQQLRTE